MDPYQEHCDFTYATDQDWDNAEASELSAANPEDAWVLTDRDVWHANPYYQGPPVPHPEDDYAWEALTADDPLVEPYDGAPAPAEAFDDDIPF